MSEYFFYYFSMTFPWAEWPRFKRPTHPDPPERYVFLDFVRFQKYFAQKRKHHILMVTHQPNQGLWLCCLHLQGLPLLWEILSQERFKILDVSSKMKIGLSLKKATRPSLVNSPIQFGNMTTASSSSTSPTFTNNKFIFMRCSHLLPKGCFLL